MQVVLAADEHAVAVLVRDHGVGLRPGEASLVFNRFWRAEESRARRTGGTGLGLSIAVEDARLHGGWLQAWGVPGKGAVFRLTLPPQRGRRAGVEPAAARPGAGHRRVGSARPSPRRRWAGRPSATACPPGVRDERPCAATARDVPHARRPRAAARSCWLALAGCASVPDSSPVQVLRQVGGDEAAPPPGPVDGSNPLDLVRDFVTASGSSTDKHAAARAFLAPEAARWDDTAGVTVLDGQIDTVPAPGAPDSTDRGHHHPHPRHPDRAAHPGRGVRARAVAVPVGRRRRPARRAVAHLPAARRRRRAAVDLPGRLPHRAHLVRRPHAAARRRRRAVRAERARQGAGRAGDRPAARRAVQRARQAPPSRSCRPGPGSGRTSRRARTGPLSST